MLNRVPGQSLLIDGAGNGAAHRRATRGEDYAFIYSPDGAPFTVRLGSISGSFIRATWFNSRSGQGTVLGTFENLGEHRFMPPQAGEARDWVLVLDDESKNFPVPGQRL